MAEPNFQEQRIIPVCNVTVIGTAQRFKSKWERDFRRELGVSEVSGVAAASHL